MAKQITHTGVVTTPIGGFAAGAFTSTIYLADVGARSGLGGGLGIYHKGQDQYLDNGATITLQATGDVLLSITKGILFKLLALGLVTITDV